nr:unnamed protein product [Callosobruchus analis]
MVLIKNDGLPSTRWQLGRVVSVYLGAEGGIRVADVATKRELKNQLLQEQLKVVQIEKQLQTEELAWYREQQQITEDKGIVKNINKL